jgi:hypothetical protein
MRSGVLAVTALVLVVTLSGGAAARSGVAIQNYENVPIVRADNAALTSARVRAAIVSAALQGRSKWTILEDTPGRIVATLSIRSKHSLTVEVRYSEAAFSVTYRDSSNLNYAQGANGPIIHPTYNKEVKALVDAINANLQRV